MTEPIKPASVHPLANTNESPKPLPVPDWPKTEANQGASIAQASGSGPVATPGNAARFVPPASGVENKSSVQGHVPPVSTPPVNTDEKNKELADAVAAKGESLKNPEKDKPTQSAEKIAVHDKIIEILREYDNKESEIGLTHEYWGLLNQYRGMR